jgi:hypothetical protein
MILPMLCLILILGGLPIMMGQHDRSEALFYYFRLEDHRKAHRQHDPDVDSTEHQTTDDA